MRANASAEEVSCDICRTCEKRRVATC